MPSMRKLHSLGSTRGVGPAVRTGKPRSRYWPGGSRSAPGPCGLPTKPRETNPGSSLRHRAEPYASRSRRPQVLGRVDVEEGAGGVAESGELGVVEEARGERGDRAAQRLLAGEGVFELAAGAPATSAPSAAAVRRRGRGRRAAPAPRRAPGAAPAARTGSRSRRRPAARRRGGARRRSPRADGSAPPARRPPRPRRPPSAVVLWSGRADAVDLRSGARTLGRPRSGLADVRTTAQVGGGLGDDEGVDARLGQGLRG